MKKIHLLPCIILLYFMMMTNQVQSQDTLQYPLHTNKVEVGISAGMFILFFTDLELNLTVNRRISNSLVVEFKPVTGLISQLYLFEGNDSRYRIVYGGGTIGMNFGKRNKFFEVTTGSAYFHSATNPWGGSTSGFKLIGTFGYKSVGEKNTFRIGLGFPHGAYIGFNF